MLNYTEYGEAAADRPSLFIVHGLYGSGRNWGVIAKRLSDNRHVVTVDMRNHGSSPHHDTHSYPEMAQDLAEVITHLGGPVDICGHSMGGKAVMMLALTQPDLLRRVIVADIAPVTYGHTQQMFIDAMRGVDLTQIERRSDAEAQLATAGVERALQSFFTQSLDVPGKRWRLNLDALEACGLTPSAPPDRPSTAPARVEQTAPPLFMGPSKPFPPCSPCRHPYKAGQFAKLGGRHAETYRHPVDHDHWCGADCHRTSLRVRLFRRTSL